MELETIKGVQENRACSPRQSASFVLPACCRLNASDSCPFPRFIPKSLFSFFFPYGRSDSPFLSQLASKQSSRHRYRGPLVSKKRTSRSGQSRTSGSIAGDLRPQPGVHHQLRRLFVTGSPPLLFKNSFKQIPIRANFKLKQGKRDRISKERDHRHQHTSTHTKIKRESSCFIVPITSSSSPAWRART